MTQFARLHTDEASLILELRDGAPPLWRHLGARINTDGLLPLAELRRPASYSLDADVAFSVAPPAGLGWFGPAVLTVRVNGHDRVPVFDQVEVTASADGIRIVHADASLGLALEQTVDVSASGAFRFGATVTNTGTQPITLDSLASALVPMPADAQRIIAWRGRHNAELIETAEPMPSHAWVREGRRGIPGHGGPPAVVVMSEGASRHRGLVFALQLAWSGDHRIAIEHDDEGFRILSAGMVLQPGEIVLRLGESYSAPSALLAISTAGRNGASAIQHATVRAGMIWHGGTMRPRPVHLNSWEACYFGHDEARISKLADAAAGIGIERFVLDDGWFKGRNNDRAGLGDWTTDLVKYPRGLGPLAAKITGLGMAFGLWVEPEMVNPDSDLYRAHPGWVLALPEAQRPTARNQLVLDLRRADVRDYLFGCIDKLLTELPITYLKWDHNRDLAPAGGSAQVSGLYDLLGRIRAEHPNVEIESCAGGGGRIDAGIAAYTHRFWTSDNIDAVSRVEIQRGFLAFMPPETMGAHVGASPAHATGRSQSLAFRAAIAMPGHFGVELDPATLNQGDRDELAGWIAFHKQWRDLLHGGLVWLGEGCDGLVWQAQGQSGEFLLFVIRRDPMLGRRPQPLLLPFVDCAASYRVELLRVAGGPAHRSFPVQTYSGSWLANAGLPVPPLKGESVAIFHGKRTA